MALTPGYPITELRCLIGRAEGGYKWFDAEGKEPLFPVGFALSYTNVAYSPASK